MKATNLLALTTALLAVSAWLAPAQQTPPMAVAKVVSDGAGAKPKRVDNTHKTRFIEIFLAHREAKTGKTVAECYNTMFTLGGIPTSKDTAPQAQVEGLDFVAMKKELGVAGASLNGPKLWLSDWAEMDAGVERTFNGIAATWIARLNMGDNGGGVGETKPYQPQTIARKSSLGWNKGTTVLLLDDAEGNTWIMKGFQLGLKPQPAGGVATIMADELFNVYDKTGPGMTNYKS
jgi:hypothetical protein